MWDDTVAASSPVMGKDKDKDRDSDSSDNDGLKSEADREAD
jgi:hypothetical protein